MIKTKEAKVILFIGTVWPEPNSSAAGIRILQLLQFFLTEGYAVHFASTAKLSPYSFDLAQWDISTHPITLNNPSFDKFVQKIAPTIVLYDRFMIEEQFGWRIREQLPNTIHVLDTEDLHFLREARRKFNQIHPSPVSLSSLEITQREIASIYRCDLSLIISSTEIALLTNDFNIPKAQLFYLPFLEEKIKPHTFINLFEQRENFVFIGNFLHLPNWKAIQILKTKIWPLIRNKIPTAELHIYGAYSRQREAQLHNKKDGFIIKGRAENAISTLQKYRILLSPLTFGAGIKGKFLDATKAGTPYITTEIGAEGLTGCSSYPIDKMASIAIQLYQDKKQWTKHQENNVTVFNSIFDKTLHRPSFQKKISQITTQLSEHRAKNIVGGILLREQFKSTKYLSLWIQEKES